MRKVQSFSRYAGTETLSKTHLPLERSQVSGGSARGGSRQAGDVVEVGVRVEVVVDGELGDGAGVLTVHDEREEEEGGG